MIPKEKAKELVNRFLEVNDGIDYDNGCGVTIYQAKQCALICVDEIISALENHKWQNQKVIDFYKEVKAEIHKL
jgi:hypothetical protein